MLEAWPISLLQRVADRGDGCGGAHTFVNREATPLGSTRQTGRKQKEAKASDPSAFPRFASQGYSAENPAQPLMAALLRLLYLVVCRLDQYWPCPGQ